MRPSDRLQRVLAIGDTLALFPVLKDWTTEELQALLKDVDEFTLLSHEAIEKAWEKAAFEPSVFLSGAGSKLLDRVRDEEKLRVMAVMSEICSVVFFYLHERGVPDALDESAD